MTKENTTKEKTKKITISSDQLFQMFENERAKLQAIDNELRAINSAIAENEGARQAIEALEKSEDGCDILISLGGQYFASAKYNKKDTIKKMVAGKAMIEISIEDAKKEIENAKVELNKAAERAFNEQQLTITNIQNMAKLIDIMRQAALSKGKQ